MDKRTWAEINLDNLAHNMREVKRLTSPGALITAVVKSDAYGHGVIRCCEVLLENGADRFAVATLSEAKQLRRHGINVPILILGASEEHSAKELVEYDIIPAVFDTEFAKALSREAVRQNKTARIHIKLDTGMTRLGFVAKDGHDDEITDEIIAVSKLPNIETEGIFSHFATSDEADTSYMRSQFECFLKINDMLIEKGLDIPIKHIANSAAIMMYPQTHLDMVRAGIILYGMYPSDEVDKTKADFKYVMSLKSRITLVKEVSLPGRGVSYGKEYITRGKVKIATVPVGYADGYIRRNAKNGKIYVNNTPCPILGRICMDQCMIDVTNVHNIKAGDVATVFGTQGVTVDDVAHNLDTINYEVTCCVNKRIPRVFIKNNKVEEVQDCLDIL